MINLHQTSKEEGNILTFLRLLKQFFLQYVEKYSLVLQVQHLLTQIIILCGRFLYYSKNNLNVRSPLS